MVASPEATPSPSPGLANDLADLAEQLVTIAQRARRLANEGDFAALHDQLATLRDNAASAEGPQLLLLEVAEAFLRALCRTDLGRTELELRRFVTTYAEAAETLLLQLVDRGRLSRDEISRLTGPLGDAVRELVHVGALRELDGGAIDLRPSLRSLARDLVSPPAFRYWSRVDAARRRAARDHLDAGQAATALAADLGVTAADARRHLRSNPLASTGSAPAPYKPRTAEEQGLPLVVTSGAPPQEYAVVIPLTSRTAHSTTDAKPFPHKARPKRLEPNPDDLQTGDATLRAASR